MTFQPRQDLLVLEDRLLRDTRNFDILLSKMPRNIFVKHHETIILNPEYYMISEIDRSPVFAHFSENGTVRIDHQTRPWVQPDHLDSLAKISFRSASSGPLTEQLLAFKQLPPISWITQSPGGGDAWEKQAQALIDYSLLKWAFDSEYTGKLPQPDYDHLSQLLTILTKTPQYEQLRIMRENEESAYFAKPTYGAGGVQDPETGLRTPIDESWPAPTMACTQMIPCSEVLEADLKCDSKSPPSDPTPTVEQDFDRSASSHELGSSRQSSRDRSTTIETSATLENSSFPSSAATTISPDVEMVDSNIPHKLPCAHPTDDSQNHVAMEQIDPELSRLYDSLGRDLLSNLPGLKSMVFEKGGDDQAGFLPLQLKVGTFKSSANPSLQNHQMWVLFKIHAVNTKSKSASAPRLLLCARHAETGAVIDDNIKLPDILAHVDFIPVLSNLDTGKQGDMQLKAIVKYYYILAANANLYGFSQHRMPVNNTFVEQLRTVCEKHHPGTTTNPRQHHQAPPPKKRRKLNPPTSLPSPPKSEDQTPPLQQHQHPLKRSTRRVRTTPPSPTSPSNTSFHHTRSATTPKPPPRKPALGRLPSPTSTTPAINQFLLPLDTIDAADSSGESGDEIPFHIPGPSHTHSLLLSQTRTKRMLEYNRGCLKQSKTKRDSARYAIRSLKGQMTKNARAGEAELEKLRKEVRVQEEIVGVLGRRVKVFEDAVGGFVEEKKRGEDKIKRDVERRVEREWGKWEAEVPW
ncbi:hypothetical protein DM02DRAFT_611123 [Periconia macrospinosa]|uniref:Uncharacterized protein n=1 Tax=Periconia macrospinosa TaxID=97972 RepID=A0A2V1E4J2_9PLEO|nr:hypothetical protein DM02DRAFT_611123 [Periconia macrospinosa]